MLEPNALPNHEQVDQMMNHKVDIMVNRLVDRLTEIVNRMVDWLIELVNLMICSKTPVHIYYWYDLKVTNEQSGEQTRWISLNRCSLHNQVEFRVIPEKRDLVLLRLP